MNKELLQKLKSKSLIFVSGKGGVGKTAVTATLGAMLAEEGRRVLMAEINSSGHIPHIYGKKAKGDEIIELDKNLYTVNVNPRDALAEYAMLILKYRALYNIVFENRMVKYFLKAVPALAELTMLGRLWYISIQEEGYRGHLPFDVFIVDSPATGHFKSFLLTPYSLEKLTPPGPMRTNAKNMDLWLRDPVKAGFALVTIPEEMPVNEAVELAAFIEAKGGMEPLCVIANRVSPFFTRRRDLAKLNERIAESFPDKAGEELERLFSLSSERERLLNRQERELERLKNEIKWPLFLLPRLNSAYLTPVEINLFAKLLKEGIEKGRSIFRVEALNIFEKGCKENLEV